MYLPYFRGRQFELIALRELLEMSLLSNKIIPVVEPVKLSSTIESTIKSFNKNNKFLALVSNPQVGDFMQSLSDDANKKIAAKLKKLCESKNILKTHILNIKSEKDLEKLIKDKNEDFGNMIMICNNSDYIGIYNKFIDIQNSKYNIILDESIFRRTIKKNRILLDDKFIKKSRNTDYADIDEPFSSDHLYYKEDGYIGFSDFSVIGNEYSKTGFAPYAVVIHIVYFDKEKNLRIRHFISNSNDDISNTAGKFGEALEKLMKWNKEFKLNTFAIQEFIRMNKDGKYPGLGTVKKLAIMHHLELIGKFLDEQKDK